MLQGEWVGGWVGGWVTYLPGTEAHHFLALDAAPKEVAQEAVGHWPVWVGGWVGGCVEEKKAVGMSYCRLRGVGWVGGWVGGWVWGVGGGRVIDVCVGALVSGWVGGWVGGRGIRTMG